MRRVRIDDTRSRPPGGRLPELPRAAPVQVVAPQQTGGLCPPALGAGTRLPPLPTTTVKAQAVAKPEARKRAAGTAKVKALGVPHPAAQPKKMEALLALFNELDADGDGQISCREFENIPGIMRGLHMGPEFRDIQRQLQARSNYDQKTFRRIDKDRSGLIDYTEFIRWMVPAMPPSQVKAATAMHTARLIARAKELADVKEAQEKNWETRYAPETVAELKKIFAMYGEVVAPGVVGITRRSMGHMMRRPGMTDDILEELFLQFEPTSAVPDPHGHAIPPGSPPLGRRRSLSKSARRGGGGGAPLSPRRRLVTSCGLPDVDRRRTVLDPTVPPYIGIEAFASIMEDGQVEYKPPPALWFQNPRGQANPQQPMCLPGDFGV